MNILETAAHTHSPYLHPGGETLTEVLIEKLALQPGQQVLEIGCGTGATAARLAQTIPVRIIAFDRLLPMLTAAQTRFQQGRLASISLLTANANAPFPFAPATFDAIYAESVLALTQLPHPLREIARLLRPGGKLALNERLWKPDVTPAEAAHINTLSQTYFGIPAATPEPWHIQDWMAWLTEAGFVHLNATRIETLIPPNHQRQPRLRQRLTHLQHHLRHPKTYFRNLQFRFFGKRYEKLWGRMEAVLLTGRLKDG
ncbi:MAG: hypothetical protein Fur0022_25850 [Anaerolineales bacterium]